VFGSDICTCRPYLIHAIEECVRTAVEGGTGEQGGGWEGEGVKGMVAAFGIFPRWV
jgi:GTP cyclohydrolase II